MNLSAIPLLDVLRERMSWLSTRQNVLSQNVANADTPGYTARDLKPLDFANLVKQNTRSSQFHGGLTVTNPRHISVSMDSISSSTDGSDGNSNVDVTNGAVSIEEEMMKVADTQTQYQAATDLYAKAIGMMRTAIDRSGP